MPVRDHTVISSGIVQSPSQTRPRWTIGIPSFAAGERRGDSRVHVARDDQRIGSCSTSTSSDTDEHSAV